MELRPNDLPDMELNEVRTAVFKFAPILNGATISSAAFACDCLTFGTPSVSGGDVSVRITASEAGDHKIIVTLTLSSGDTPKGFVRVRVIDNSGCDNSEDY